MEFNLFDASNIIIVYGNDLLLLDHLIGINGKAAYYYDHIFREWKRLDEIIDYTNNEFTSSLCVPAILNNKEQDKVFVLCSHDIEQLTNIDINAIVLSNQNVVFYNPIALDINLPVYSLSLVPNYIRARALYNLLSSKYNGKDLEKQIDAISQKYNDLSILDLYIAFDGDKFNEDVILQFRKKSTSIIQFTRPKTKPEFLVGFDELFNWVDEYIKLKNVATNKSILPKGIIIRGIPGSGKTEAVRAIANKYFGELMILYPGAIYNRYVGSSEDNIQTLINYLTKLNDGILLIDEIDKMLTWGSETVDAGVSKRVMGVFLTWLAEREPGILIVGTTNKFDSIPPEMIRRGRFDRVFDAPDRVKVSEMIPKLETKYGIRIEIDIEDRELVGSECEGLILDLYRKKLLGR